MSAEESDINFSAPVKSVSIENMVRMRAAVLERFERAVTILHEASDIAAKAHVGFPSVEIEKRYRTGGTPILAPDAHTAAVRAIDSVAWAYLMTESGLFSLMDAKAREKWNDQIEKGEFPEFTAASVESTFQSLHAARGEMFCRGVIECFRKLSWDYKTNKPFCFGKRIIVEWLFTRYRGSRGSPDWLSVNHGKCDQLDDLVRVMSVLDGKPEPDYRQGVYRLLNDAQQARVMTAEHEYFSIKWFLKGTGHITFKRSDLVDQMNDILARYFPGALPAPRGTS